MTRQAVIRQPRIRIHVSRVLLYAGVIVAAGFFVLPYIWLITRSFMPYSDIFTYPTLWIPRTVTLQHFYRVLTRPNWPFLQYLRNTVLITGGVLVGRLLTASLAAYGFARIRFPGRDALFIVALATMMVPFQVTMIPTYLLFKYIGWLNTLLPLIVPAFGGGGAFYIFMLRQFVMSLPFELDDAARLDGCGRLGIFWFIIVPLLKPALLAVTLFSFIETWNDFLQPLVFLTNPKLHTLAIALQHFVNVMFTEFELAFAATVIVMIPPLLLFFFGQRYFVEGMVMSGIKG